MKKRKRNFPGRTRIAVVWTGILLAMAGSYWAGVHQMPGNVSRAPKTYTLALAPFGRRVDFQLSVGQLGLAVIFMLLCLLLVAIAFALIAERQRQEVRATNSRLLDEIVERKQAQEEVNRLNADLEQKVEARTIALKAANKELEAFCFSVSHDLRAPLRAVDGFAEVLLKDYQDRLDEQGVRYLERVRSATRRMAQLIDDLLSLSRVTRTDMRRETVDLTTAAREAVTELRRLEPERNVEVKIAEGLRVHGDPRLLRQVLENLLGNAWKYTSKQPAAQIEMGACGGRNGQPAFFIKDNGAGFDMRYAHKLFGVFQRLHSASDFPGTGVGLATVQRIVQRHGGEVWAEGSVGEGATFYFTL